MIKIFYAKKTIGFIKIVSCAAILSVATTSALAKDQSAMSFIAIGDTPYSETENKRIKSEISKAIKDAHPPFVVHHGDLKGGGEACTEELLTDRRNDVYGLLPGRVFYTPGDNEWTDCDRAFLEPAVSELGKLDLLRQLFFSKPLDLPETWLYARQPNFPENARWMKEGVFFMTVHLVSTNNGRREILKDDIEAALSLVDARDQANRVWMKESFKAALKAGAKAMVIVTQADVTSPNAGGACTATNRMHCDAFQSFRENLRLDAGNFAERDKPRKPVLLLHGDTSPYCMDREFGGKLAPNLWRLNAWGDFQDPADATVVTVTPGSKKTPFAAETLLGHQVPDDGCK